MYTFSKGADMLTCGYVNAHWFISEVTVLLQSVFTEIGHVSVIEINYLLT